MSRIIVFVTIIYIHSVLVSSEYIPPGPKYTCPDEQQKQLIHPCVCENGTDAGLHVRCENTGLAVLSVGIGNLAGLGFPIEKLTLKECHISNLYGPLLYRSTIRTIFIIDTPIKTIDQYAFSGVNKTLHELHMFNTKIQEFPKEAFKILGSLTALTIDGHRMTKLAKDTFAGSEAAGRLEKLRLVNGMISDIAAETFQNLKKLKVLDLHGNRLGNLKRNQFRGLRDTEVLDISHNNITKLDGSHIGDMSKLGWCNVSHNQIADIPRGMFGRNTLLKVLHLDNNKIKKLDTNSFKGIRLLRRLYLQDNQISDVGRGTFGSVTRIGTIDLARNLITKVDFQMFQAAKYAELINLAENQITTIEGQAFSDLYHAVVNVSHNQLETIERNAFTNCNNMTLLEFSYNKLKTIVRGAFEESFASELKLDHNLIEDFREIPIQNMTGIQILNVSYNQITKIPKLAFPAGKLYELHTVDLSHNNLTEIANAVFQTLLSLRFLDLSHNQMEMIKPASFGTVPTILELNLSHNQLKQVSRGALASLASCRVLRLSYNRLESLFQIPISLAELDMSHNNLSEVKANTWPVMNALLRLNLSHNHLEDSLSGDSFSGLLTLQGLDLSANGLSRPPWQAVNTLSSLQYLHLQENNLTSLSKSAFGILRTTFQLDLSYNQISSIEPLAFNGLQQLQDLSLRGNELRHVPNEAFKTLVALTELDLSHNYLEKIDNTTNGLLDDCLSLVKVNLSHNNIGFLTKKMFPASPWYPYRISEVDLSYNALPVLTFDITVGGKTFKKLYLAGNSINDIKNNVLGNLTSLQVLDLSNNQLTDLVSSYSELEFHLPPNLTHFHLENNELESLPMEELNNLTALQMLDVRNNRLKNFEPYLVKKMKENGLEVLYQGNDLTCDCQVRPLRHYIDSLSPTAVTKTAYNLTCTLPPALSNQSLVTIEEDRLLCARSVDLDEKLKDEEFLYEAEPDVAFRDVTFSQPSIHLSWFVRSTKDVADFYVYIRDENNAPITNENLTNFNTMPSYNLRSLTITIDKDMEASLKKTAKIDICIQTKTSSMLARRWYQSQCKTVDDKFDSWPKKLNLDRRMTKKKTKYSWFGNNVLGLVSDSILITLCIFLGACFRKLADVDV